jgi:hypothetical protein
MAEKLTVLGARGASATEIARKTGNWGVMPSDSDYQALTKLGQALLEDNPGFQSTVPGPAGPTYTTLSAFRAAPVGNKRQSLADPNFAFGDYFFETANPPYVEALPFVIKANDLPLSAGAWVRQKASAVSVTLDGGRTRTVADELSDSAVSAARFPGWGADYAAAIRAAIATGKDVYIPMKGALLLTSSLGTTQPNQRIFGRGKGMTVLQKAFNGDMVTLGLRSSLTDLTLDGNGGSFTGRGVVITEGDSAGTGYQRVDRVSIVRMAGYCVEWTQNAAGWGGGMLDCDVRRSNDAQACLKMPETEANGNRCLVNVFAGSGPLIDFDGAANVQAIGCTSGSAVGATNAFRTNKTSAKIQIIGGRYAVGGGKTTLLGQNHTVVGISHAGPFQLGDGTTNSLANSKGSANDFAGFAVTDLSNTDLASVNAFDLPLQTTTPAWTTGGTAPSLGNGLLAAAVSRSGGHVTFDLDLVFGSTTTAGTGTWWFKTPVKNFGRRAVGAAWMVDDSAGSVFVGAAIIEPSTDMIQVYPHQANIAQSNSPFTWTDKDKLSFTITYLAG